MRLPLAILSSLLLVGLTGCPPQQMGAPQAIPPAGSGGTSSTGSTNAVAQMTQLRDQMCACTEQTCALAIEPQYNQWHQGINRATMNPQDTQSLGALENEYHSCHGRAMAGGAAPAECGNLGVCAQGTECIEYYGIAGAAGPKMFACDTRCDANGQCANGMKCVTMADGPGAVCRANTATPTVPAPLPAQGQKCGAADACAAGLECVKYYGIAGPAGGQFTSCEIKCSAKSKCPSGQACTTMADGPGQVCRATK